MFHYGKLNDSNAITEIVQSETRINDGVHVFLSAEDDFTGESYIGRKWPRPSMPKPFTYKTDIWQRVTDEEAVTLDTQLQQAPAKQRRMWDDSLSVEHSSDDYGLLREQMVQAFGEDRTVEILAPSQG